MLRLTQGRQNLALGTTAFLVSSAGSVLLQIVLAILIYNETGSATMTALFVALQWCPMLLVILYRTDWDTGMNPRQRWYLLDLTAAVLTLPMLYLIEQRYYLAIIMLLLLRGFFDQINRVNKTVAARVLFDEQDRSSYASIMQSGYHIGIALAAIAGIVFINRFSLITIVLLDIGSYLLSAGLIWMARPFHRESLGERGHRQSVIQRMRLYLEALKQEPRLLFCALLPPLTATFFQGTYSTLQPIYPVDGLGRGSEAVAASYIIAAVAVVAGSTSFSLFCRKYRLFNKSFVQTVGLVIVTSALSIGAYMLTLATASPWAAALCFACMVFFFEFTWMNGYAGIVEFAPKGNLGSVFSISFAAGCIAASLVGLALGIALDATGNAFASTIGAFLAVYAAAILVSSAVALRSTRDVSPGAQLTD